MKTLAIIITALLLAGGLSAQENNSVNTPASNQKQEKKEQREALLSRQFKETTDLINSQRFVLEADFLDDKYGYRRIANNDLNFILVDSSQAVIQTGSNTGIGYNGVGGLTATGHLTSWKVMKNDKKKSNTVEMNITSNIGFFRVLMNVNASGRATATLSGNGSGRLNYVGRLVPLEDSYAFKGSSF